MHERKEPQCTPPFIEVLADGFEDDLVGLFEASHDSHGVSNDSKTDDSLLLVVVAAD